MKIHDGPKILFIDIETAPIVAYVWSLFNVNISLNQIKEDWYILSFSAKWLHEPASKMIFESQEKIKPMNNDKKLVQSLWTLLDEADIIVTQNGKRFDEKKINARMAIHKMKPYSSIKHIDILELNKKHFGFTSNKLEYVSNILNKKHKKLKHIKFPGQELWNECLKGNPAAWKEMRKYNPVDVLALEEAYKYIITWGNPYNFNLWRNGVEHVCTCGSKRFKENGTDKRGVSMVRRYKCLDCGAEVRDRENLFSREKRKSLKVTNTR